MLNSKSDKSNLATLGFINLGTHGLKVGMQGHDNALAPTQTGGSAAH